MKLKNYIGWNYFLGCYIGERIFSHVFKDVQRMSLNNKGYDIICNKGFK